MITNKPAHGHKLNSDCFARFLIYMLCSFSNPVICTMCLLLHTLFLLFVVCPKMPPIFSVSSSAQPCPQSRGHSQVSEGWWCSFSIGYRSLVAYVIFERVDGGWLLLSCGCPTNRRRHNSEQLEMQNHWRDQRSGEICVCADLC